MKTPFLAAASAALAVLCMVGSNEPARAQSHGHHAHHPAQQGVISLDVYRDGSVIHLLSGEQRDERMSLWHRRSDDAGLTWSAPVRVDGPGAAPRPTRRGDEAQIAARGDMLLAVWSVAGSGWGGSGPLASGVSRDGGKTWLPGARPSDSGLTTGEGFADLVAGKESFHAVWLDSRDKAQGLRYSASRDGKSWSRNDTIAAATCECCWNTLLMRGDIPHVLFRGKDPRDMELAVRPDNTWQRRGNVGAFNWRIKGCPEAGGGLAATADGTLHALVWTGLEGKSGLYATRTGSFTGWTEPRRMGGPDAQHSDLASSKDTLAAVWDEGGKIMAAFSRDSGKTWTPASAISTEGVRAENPRVVAAGDAFVAAWTQGGGDGERTLGLRRLMPPR